MEAPEKIYLQPLENNEIFNHCYTFKLNNDFIEYTSTDAFIEKACEFLAENMTCNGYTLQTKAKFIRGFRNYMKGE